MASQPRATDVREGLEGSEAGDFRSGLLLLDHNNRVVSATEGMLAAFSMGFVLQLPAPVEILPGELVEMIRQVRRTGQSMHSLPIHWKRSPEGTKPWALEVDLLPFSHLSSQPSPFSMCVAIRRLPTTSTEAAAHPGVLVMDQAGLLSEVGHEIKNSLVSIKTFVELLLEEQPQQEMARVVRDGVDRISGSVSRLLNASNPRMEFQSVSVHQLLQPLLQMVRSQMGKRPIDITLGLTASRDTLRAQPRQIEQALLNLMMNGLEAMSGGGTLSVTTENRDMQLNDGEAPRSCILVTISDTGCGIPPHHMPRLFDEFFTTKQAGTGLGLPITRRIIMAHSGRMEVESQPGKGTTFRLILPVA